MAEPKHETLIDETIKKDGVHYTPGEWQIKQDIDQLMAIFRHLYPGFNWSAPATD